MSNLSPYLIKIALVTVVLAYFLFYFHTAAQERNAQTSLFKPCWKLETDKMTQHGLASDNESNIYLSFLNGKIESINLKTREKNWESELGGEVILPPLLDNRSIFVISKMKTKILLRSLSKGSGVTNWQAGFDLDEEVFLFKNTGSLVICSKSGKVFIINKETGLVIWSRNLEEHLTTIPRLIENRLIFGTASRKILLYSIESGDILFQIDVPFPLNIVSIIENKYLFWGDYKGNAYLSSLDTKKIIWKMRSGAEITQVFDTQQGLLISSLDNFIYLISVKKGKLIWKRRIDERRLFDFASVGNYIVTVKFGSGFADIISMENGKVISQFVIESNNYFTNAPLVFGNLLIFPTVRGVVGFANSEAGCVLR